MEVTIKFFYRNYKIFVLINLVFSIKVQYIFFILINYKINNEKSGQNIQGVLEKQGMITDDTAFVDFMKKIML